MRERLAAALSRSLAVAAALAVIVGLPAAARGQEIDCNNPGEKEVRSLKFTGNTTLSDDELSSRVLTTPSTFTHRYFGWFFGAGVSRCLPDVGLAPDVRALKQFYQDNGFYETKVDTVVAPVGPSRVAVTFRVDEGPPMLVDTLKITGLDSVTDSAAVVRQLQLRVGGRFGRIALLADMDTISARLRDRGYPRATVLRGYHTDPSTRRAQVDLTIVPGPRARFGTIAIERSGVPPAGPEIDSAVVLRLLGFRTGDRYSDRALLDAQRNLYNLGAFRHVGIDLDTARQVVDTLANVRVDVGEDYMRGLTHEEGWATLDCFFADAQYTDKNFFDAAWHLDLNGRVSKLGYGSPTRSSTTRNLCYRSLMDQDSVASSKLNYHAGATVRQPTLFGGHWIPSYSAYTERRGEFKAYLRTTYLGADVSATRFIGDRMPLRLGYTLEYGQTQAEPVFLCALFARCDEQGRADVQKRQPFAVASAGIQRTRTDNVVDPRSGYMYGAELRMSSPVIASDPSLTFYKTTGDGAAFYPVSRRMTFALRLRAGYITGGRTAGTKLPPPQERLYAGGATSVRGFQQNELGPLIYLVDSSAFKIVPLTDSTAALIATESASAKRTIPVGGNRLVVVNLELRIRDPFFPELLEYVPFIDAGQLFSEGGLKDLNLNRLPVTPGLGIRYFSPVGPIQLNAGYNPSKTRSGQAYWASTQGGSPLICVTAPGAPVAPVRVSKEGVLEQNVDNACPISFVPFHSSNFFNRIAFTLSIGTSF